MSGSILTRAFGATASACLLLLPALHYTSDYKVLGAAAPPLAQRGGAASAIEVRAATTAAAIASRLTTPDVRRLDWLHVPKCGTTFINALWSALCPAIEQSWICYNETCPWNPAKEACPEVFKRWNSTYRTQMRSQGIFEPPAHPGCYSGHGPILRDSSNPAHCHVWNQSRGHFASVFRKPMSRIVSGWAHAKHDFKSARTFEVYRDKIAGCATRMIAGYECSGTNWERIHSVTALLDTAIDRLHEGFAFVGIAEEWELSMCLFFRMYGGCHKRAFVNTRPGRQMGTKPPTADLLNWTDPWDETLYAHAVAIYRSLKVRYNISNFTCRTEVCKEWPFPFMDNFTVLPILGRKR